MSIETLLAEHTAALKENTEQLKLINSGRDAALAAAQALQSGDKPAKAAKAAEKKADKPAGPPSVDDVRKAFGDYLGVDDATEREARKAKVKQILAKSGDDITKATDIPEGARAQAITWVNTLAAGEDVPELDEGGGEEDAGLI